VRTHTWSKSYANGLSRKEHRVLAAIVMHMHMHMHMAACHRFLQITPQMVTPHMRDFLEQKCLDEDCITKADDVLHVWFQKNARLYTQPIKR